MANQDRTHMQKHVGEKQTVSSFSTATYQHRNQKNLQLSNKASYRLVVWDFCGEVHFFFFFFNFLHRRAGKLILPDLSLSTEQKMTALGILNYRQQLIYNKGIIMHEVLNNNNSQNYLAQLFISRQFHYTKSRNNLYVPRPRLDLFKTNISFAGASLWNSLPQNVKSCISPSCCSRNLHNLSSNLDGFI